MLLTSLSGQENDSLQRESKMWQISIVGQLFHTSKFVQSMLLTLLPTLKPAGDVHWS
jgi:hypothetical protein